MDIETVRKNLAYTTGYIMLECAMEHADKLQEDLGEASGILQNIIDAYKGGNELRIANAVNRAREFMGQS